MKNLYVMTEQQIELLASERTRSASEIGTADGTYLRALIVAVQSKLGVRRGKRPATDTQISVLDERQAVFYAAVLRGVTTDDITIEANTEHAEAAKRNRERHRRATFARSAKSTIATWVRAGGDIRAIDATSVTKTELRTSVAAANDDAAMLERTLKRATGRIIATVTQEARGSPDRARAWLEGIIGELTEQLEDMGGEGPRHAESTVIRTRVGTPTFREPRVLNRAA